MPDEPVSSDYVTGLARSPTGWENYRSADEDAPTATSLLEHMVEQDWADSFSQWDDVTRALGEGVHGAQQAGAPLQDQERWLG